MFSLQFIINFKSAFPQLITTDIEKILYLYSTVNFCSPYISNFMIDKYSKPLYCSI